MRRVAAGVLALATAFGGMAIGATTATAATNRDSYADTLGDATFEAARQRYGLTEDMSHGTILHAWMWSFNTITANMKDIAEAGYTSIQTEPMSHIKTNTANGKKFTENWYYVYQPTSTSIGNFVVGTQDDLKRMCAEAHKYGIRIIVDVVANHFTSDWNAIDSSWKDASLFHKRSNCSGANGDNINYGNRWQVTQCHLLGLWDINTQNQTAANKMKEFLVQAVNDGVDGFRFDAAKHVELPDELGEHSVYWDTILENGAQYQYGEVLQGDSGLDYRAYANLMTNHSSRGGGNTASDYGRTVRSAVKSRNLSAGSLSNMSKGGVADDQLVTWVESHDNYANGDKESTYLTNDQLRFGWALVASRSAGAPLYFNRPVGSGGTNPQFAEVSQLGDAGDGMWKDKAVVQVNKFHNKMDGNAEYLRNCPNNGSCLMVERYAKDGQSANDGVVITNMGGDTSLAGTATTLDDGTYTDQVNGGAITVSGGKITAGTAKGNAVSAYYSQEKAEQVAYVRL
nr:amylase [uncultured bacterium]